VIQHRTRYLDLKCVGANFKSAALAMHFWDGAKLRETIGEDQ
jgi:hypothetical protein